MATGAASHRNAKAERDKAEITGSNRSVIWLSGLACGVLAAIAPGIATVAAGLLAPGVVALRLDREPGRPVARTVLTCGLAGCVHPVITLWNTGQSFATAIAIVTDPTTIGIAWSAAGRRLAADPNCPAGGASRHSRPSRWPGRPGCAPHGRGSVKPGVWTARRTRSEAAPAGSHFVGTLATAHAGVSCRDRY